MLLRLERDRTAAALSKRFDQRLPVPKLLQMLQTELGLTVSGSTATSKSTLGDTSPNATAKSGGSPTIRAAAASGGDLTMQSSRMTMPYKTKMTELQRKHLETIREVKRKEVPA